MIESGVFPIISLASKPIAKILLSCSETATTEGSFNITPLPGKNTRVFAVPKSIPNFFEKIPIPPIYHICVKMNGWEKMPKEFYTGRYSYRKLAAEAKMLYQACDEVLDDSIWALDKMKYLAEKGKFDWSIITCLKHKLK